MEITKFVLGLELIWKKKIGRKMTKSDTFVKDKEKVLERVGEGWY